jgi:hypothetical protein
MIYRRKARLNATRIPIPARKAMMAVMVCGLALAACEKPARPSAAAAGDAGLKELTLMSERFAPVKLAPRMRNRYAPVHVAQDVDVVRLTATPKDPGAEVHINGVKVPAGGESPDIPLRPGLNSATVEVTAPDGKTKIIFSPKVFRDYPGPAWKKVADKSPWMPRDSAGELVFDGRMWLIGGFTPGLVKDVWSSRDGVTWTRVGEISASRSGVDIPLAFVFKNKMWVSDADNVLYSSADGVDWSMVTDKAPWRGRGAAGGVVFRDRLWVLGGAGDGKFFNDVWSSEDGVNWTLEVKSAPWSKRTLHNTPLVLDDKMWIIGGAATGDYYPYRTYNDVWCSADGRAWKRVTDEAPWPGRTWGSAAVYKGRLWLLGGFRSEPTWENLDDVWYSADGMEWHQLTFPATCRHSGDNNAPVVVNGSVWVPRHEMSVYAFEDKLWVAGGMVWPLMNDVWRLEIPGLMFLTQPVIEDFVGTRYVYRARADFNSCRDKVRYRLVDSPAWLAVGAESGVVEGTAPAPGDVQVTVEAYDDSGETARQSYTLHIEGGEGLAKGSEQTYRVKWLPAASVVLDGRADEPVWSKAEPETGFPFPWKQAQAPATEFRALCDETYLYFTFRVHDDDIVALDRLRDEEDEVFEDRVELYFGRDEEMKDYYCLEVDSRGRIFDYRASYPRQFDPKWNLEGMEAKASALPRGYELECRIPAKAFVALGFPALRPGAKIRCGLYRAEFSHDRSGRKVEPAASIHTMGRTVDGPPPIEEWLSWVNPKTKEPDFHVPSSMGWLEFVK